MISRFNLPCYGKQETLEDIRSNKAKKYKELFDKEVKKGSHEYQENFLRYIPADIEKYKNKELDKNKDKELDKELDKEQSIQKSNKKITKKNKKQKKVKKSNKPTQKKALNKVQKLLAKIKKNKNIL